MPDFYSTCRVARISCVPPLYTQKHSAFGSKTNKPNNSPSVPGVRDLYVTPCVPRQRDYARVDLWVERSG